MSALSAQRMALDALMGNQRNEVGDQPKSRVKWDDREVCPYFLCGFCPHDLFPATKNDLGVCEYKLHEEYLRDSFLKEPYSAQHPLEVKFYNYLQKIVYDLERRMVRTNRNRTDLTEVKDKHLELERKQRADDLLRLNEQIQNLRKEVLDLIVAKKTSEAASLTVLMEKMEKERAEKLARVEQDVEEISEQTGGMGNKRVVLCEVCGAFLVQGDTADRLVGHFEGKQHVGFMKIRAMITDLKKKHDEYRIRYFLNKFLKKSSSGSAHDNADRRNSRDKRDSRRDSRDKRDRGRSRSRSPRHERRRSRSYDRDRRHAFF